MKKVLLDTNVCTDWLNRGDHEAVMVGPGFLRYLSVVVVMELRAGVSNRASRDAVDALTRAYRSASRLVSPSSEVFERAGAVLRKLKFAGRNVRDASLCGDVLIALTARSIGATVVTSNVSDFAAIQRLEEFSFEKP